MKIRMVAAAFALVATASTHAALAADSVRLEEHESKGYFDKFGRFGAFVGMQSGEAGARSAGAAESPNMVVAPGQKFTRRGVGVDLDLLGFWDTTRFDTLIGGEMILKLGMYTGPSIEGGPDASKNYFLFRLDTAATYGLLHWDGAIKGRVSGGAGFGMDFDGGRWWTSSGRMYPQLLGRVQLGMSNLGLHASYHWIPTTTNDLLVREHRFEAGGALGPLHGGLRYIITSARASDVPDAAITREVGLFVAYAF